MKAVRYHEFGSTEVLRFDDVERPVPGAGEVLLRVAATSFNPVDDHIRLGVLAEAIPTTFPLTPGLDVSGTIVELGAEVAGFGVGDAVIAMFPLDVHGGAAEYAVVAADLVAAAPQSIDLVDAASLPLAGLAAHQAVIELAGLQAGQTVLVNGAGGAVGGIVVQLAAEAGATVTVVDVTQHADRHREYGAEHVVAPLDLDAGPAAVNGPFDVVINHVRLTPEDLTKLTAYVADGGVVVSSAGPVPADEARSVRSEGVWVAPNASALAGLVRRIDSGVLKVHVVDRRPLEDLALVHDEASQGKLLGKTVIVVN